jgi:hypothetical protein
MEQPLTLAAFLFKIAFISAEHMYGAFVSSIPWGGGGGGVGKGVERAVDHICDARRRKRVSDRDDWERVGEQPQKRTVGSGGPRQLIVTASVRKAVVPNSHNLLLWGNDARANLLARIFRPLCLQCFNDIVRDARRGCYWGTHAGFKRAGVG